MKVPMQIYLRPFLIPALVLVIGVACTTGGGTNEGETTEPDINPDCYLFTQARDTIELSIVPNDTTVTGRLEFRFFEKDKSYGSIEGEMRGDTLFANYTFTSEGLLSHRQVAFLRKGNTFVLGSGEIANAGNTDVFKNKSAIEFDGAVVLKKSDCK